METTRKTLRRRLVQKGVSFALAGLTGLMAACVNVTPTRSPAAPAAPAPAAQSAAAPAPVVPAAPAAPAQPAPSAAQAAASAAQTTAPAPLKLLKVEPVKGYIGDSFTVKGDGLPANKEVQFAWATADGGFDVKAFPETVEFYDRKFTNKRLPLGRATTDAQGQLTANLTVPDDYGEVHDFYVVIDGKDVARGGYRILPQFTMSPQQGPVGTPITITAKGIGIKAWESTWGVNYDNKYTGYVSAVSTRGAATAVIRAAGPVGKHAVDVWHAGQTVPYLNWEQSPQAHIPVFQYTFTVTDDRGAPANTLDWPSDSSVRVDASIQKTTASIIAPASGGAARAPGANAAIEPPAGSVLSRATVRASNLPAGAEVQMFYVTARGSRTSGLGWGLAEIPLGKSIVDKNGSLAFDFQIPDDLGGWHVVKIAQGDKLLAEAPYMVQPSLLSVTPRQVKQGDTFQIHIKGGGWTELDNIYAVTYDNSYIGFACAFNSSGDVTLNLRATGAPGTHLIDLYPAVYQGHGKPPWLYDTPQLTALQDNPGLALGYRTPIFRLAIEVVP